MTAREFAEVRRQVLALHRTLVEFERRDFERAHGRQSPAALLHNLIHDVTFAWLRPLTAILAQIDEVSESPEAEEAMAASVAELRDLIRPDEAGSDFQRRYAALLQQHPELVVAHGALVSALPQ
ncbi:MAG TPA: hypothetical protein VFS09_11190 [Candidatus Eisenbacteria bacterium]|nr:hypothetical protein [Candidatus Eisenbacteria bacterium]